MFFQRASQDVLSLPVAWFARLLFLIWRFWVFHSPFRRSQVIGPLASTITGPRERMVIRPADQTSTIINPSESIVIRPVTPKVIGPSQIIKHSEFETIRIWPAQRTNVIVTKSVPEKVQPSERSYWDERGWTRLRQNGKWEYSGFYYIVDQLTGSSLKFSGRIEANYRKIVPFISNPPHQCKSHSKWPCFKHVGRGNYRIQWYRAARNPDEAILYVEQILDEAVNGYR